MGKTKTFGRQLFDNLVNRTRRKLLMTLNEIKKEKTTKENVVFYALNSRIL